MEPESCPAMLVGGRRLELTKRFEDYTQCLLRNANPRVCHAELHTVRNTPGGHGDTATGGKLNRVANEIFEHDFEFARVGVEHRQGLLDLPDKAERRLLL